MKKRIPALLCLAVLIFMLAACNSGSPFTKSGSYYNGYLGLKVDIPDGWHVEDIDTVNMSSSADLTNDIGAFNMTDFGDGGYGIDLIEVWNRKDTTDSAHVGLWLFCEDYRDAPFDTEEEYLDYFHEAYGSTSSEGYVYTLEKNEPVRINGAEYALLSYRVSHSDNKDVYYSDYYIRLMEPDFHFVMNVTYWEDSRAGIQDAQKAIEEIATFGSQAA